MKQLSKSYMLRTGQMRLPVRAIKPVTQQMLIAIRDLSFDPVIGEYYMYKKCKVKCIESSGCIGCILNSDVCDAEHMIRCMKTKRRDGKSVIFIKAD